MNYENVVSNYKAHNEAFKQLEDTISALTLNLDKERLERSEHLKKLALQESKLEKLDLENKNLKSVILEQQALIADQKSSLEDKNAESEQKAIINSEKEKDIMTRLRDILNNFKKNERALYPYVSEEDVKAVLQRTKEICFESEEEGSDDDETPDALIALRNAFRQLILLPQLEIYFDEKNEKKTPKYLRIVSDRDKNLILSYALNEFYSNRSCEYSNDSDILLEWMIHVYDDIMFERTRDILKGDPDLGMKKNNLDIMEVVEIANYCVTLMKKYPDKYPRGDEKTITASLSHYMKYVKKNEGDEMIKFLYN
eukprot:GHVL01005650.1.p1 GENE.GHVL01005650.1~~GHVL01005650.1.p1  ORF type:complete len:312 (+),score=55.29 GHVL01005650.1:25-960(+)